MSLREIYVLILHHDIQLDDLKEICAGLEEEGVPYLLQEEKQLDTCMQLSAKAASNSPLQVGIGIDRFGNICVQHEKLKEDAPYLRGELKSSRQAGKNAARMVKGLSLTL